MKKLKLLKLALHSFPVQMPLMPFLMKTKNSPWALLLNMLHTLHFHFPCSCYQRWYHNGLRRKGKPSDQLPNGKSPRLRNSPWSGLTPLLADTTFRFMVVVFTSFTELMALFLSLKMLERKPTDYFDLPSLPRTFMSMLGREATLLFSTTKVFCTVLLASLLMERLV